MAFVVDASVALCWLLPGQESMRSNALLRKAKQEGAEVPALWHMEVANQLGLKLRHKRISYDNVVFASEVVALLELVIHPQDKSSIVETVFFMNRHLLTAYDAEYLALAMRRHLPLATFDKELIAAAAQAGIALVS